jgi:hypothetical protein
MNQNTPTAINQSGNWNAIDNPEAFPRPASIGNNYVTGEEGVVVDPQKGMSLRDYFAAKAMQSMCAGPGARMVADRDERYDETNWASIVAENAYEIADAMLAKRKAGRQ